MAKQKRSVAPALRQFVGDELGTQISANTPLNIGGSGVITVYCDGASPPAGAADIASLAGNDAADVDVLLLLIGECGPCLAACQGDMGGDGIVDSRDLPTTDDRC